MSKAKPSRTPTGGDDEGGGDEEPAEQGGGGAQQGELDPPNPMILMQGILDKLKILNYESEFAGEQMNGMLVHQAYFATPHPKPNEQFFYFTSLFAWLMRLNRFNFPRPDQFDDPNTTVANVMDALRKARVAVDYPPAKVKQGCGEAVTVILNLLCDGALEKVGFRMAPPVFPPDSYPEEAPVDEDEEQVSADIADTVAPVEDADDDDEDEVYVNKPAAGGDKGGGGKAQGGGDVRENKMIESNVDPNAWKVEVENVASMLKIRAESDNKEWRTHLELTKELQGNIENKVPGTEDQLSKLAKAITGDMEQISTREKYINSQYKDLVQDYHNVQEGLQEVTNSYEKHNSGVSEIKDQLAQISEELEQIRGQMEERGESMTDTGPLVRIKDAMKKVKKDIKEMDLRIGTVSHNLLHIKMHTDTTKAREEEDDED